MTSREFHERLLRRALHAGLDASTLPASQLEAYYRLLATWNQKINLTGLDLAVPTPEAFDRLFVEPLVAARHAPPGALRAIDVGSGGGSPAIPFALAARVDHLLMVEAKTRKSVFLREVIRALGLSAEVVTARFEDLLARPDLHEAYDLLTIRAVRVASVELMRLQAFVRPTGALFLFRSASEAPESPPPPLSWRATYPLIESLHSRLTVLEKQPIR